MVGQILPNSHFAVCRCRWLLPIHPGEPVREWWGGGMMSVIEATATVWVILDPAGEVVLMCAGRDAAEVVEEWTKKGYSTMELPAVAA
jgi:hypothetical protein